MTKKYLIVRIFSPVLSGFLLYKAFPQKDVSIGFIAWIALVPLLLSLEGCSKLKALFLAGLTVISGGLLIGSQFWDALTGFYKAGVFNAFLVILVFIAFFGGIHFFAFCFISRFLQKPVWFRPFVLACAWTCSEFLYSKISLQARSNLLGYTQYDVSFLYPIARVGGVYALSFFVMYINLLITQWLIWTKYRAAFFKNCLLPLFICGILVVTIFIIDFRHTPGNKSSEPIRVALLQSNLGHQLKWSSSYYNEQIDRLLEMTENAAKDDAQLIVWPSTSLILEGKGVLPEILKGISTKIHSQIELLVGARLFMFTQEGTKKFNSIILCNAQGTIKEVYLKKILMPYGEYLPFPWVDIFGKKKYFPDVYTPSKEDYTVFNVSGLKFSTPICLEILYPELIRKFFREGAEIILVFSNDNAYIDPRIPYYFLAVSKMKSIEFGMPVIRETVNGFSAVITADGKVMKMLDYGTKGILTYNFNLAPRPSFYAKTGDWFPWGCSLLTFGLILVKIYRCCSIHEKNHRVH